ncbi:MAG: GntR family transcriptional regulator [Synergistaceae bacterium]|jgi:DNA-binding GntR family transcriptional regulator|nr:GntR family transcriptional regulator [Synergistaceae bacterium]
MKIVHTIKDQIYDILKQRILRGEYQCGQQIFEQEIAAELRVSRSPVREALRLLAGEWLIYNVPNKGTFVMEYTTKDIDELTEIRLLFERNTILSLRRLTEEEKDLLLDARRVLTEAYEKNDLHAYFQADIALHRRIISFGANDLMIRLYDRLYGIMQMRSSIVLRYRPKTYPPHADHLLIIDALIAGDRETAWEINRRHLLRTGDEIKDRLQQQRGDEPKKEE